MGKKNILTIQLHCQALAHDGARKPRHRVTCKGWGNYILTMQLHCQALMHDGASVPGQHVRHGWHAGRLAEVQHLRREQAHKHPCEQLFRRYRHAPGNVSPATQVWYGISCTSKEQQHAGPEGWYMVKVPCTANG